MGKSSKEYARLQEFEVNADSMDKDYDYLLTIKNETMIKAETLHLDMRNYLYKKRLRSLLAAGYEKGKKVCYVQTIHLSK